ncbi:MAG: LolA family protein [Candidatus Omnitrophota bacterium]
MGKKIILGLSILELSLSFCKAEGFTSFRVRYLAEVKKLQIFQKGDLLYRKDRGYKEVLLTKQADKERQGKTIRDFSQGQEWRFDYERKKVEEIRYKSIPVQEEYKPSEVYLGILDFFLPLEYNTLKKESLRRNESERLKEKECEVVSGEIIKYPFLDKRCKIWIDKESNFVYRFVIYEEGEPFLTIEVVDVEINPEIEDEEFNIEIPQGFREIDITEQFAQLYRVLVQLYRLYTRSKKLEEINQILQEENEELRKKGELLSEGIREKEDGKDKHKPSVLFVERILKFVIIGIGEEEEIGLGDIFEVYRGQRNLGKVQIGKIYGDMAMAEPLTEGLIEIIREGDRLVKTGF